MPNDDIRDRYAARLDDENDENEMNAENSMSAERAASEGDEQSEQNEMNAWNVGNVKEEWKGWSVYLPEGYLGDVKDESKLLDVRLDRDVKMDRHFKPLLIALGMERLEGMDDQEVEELLERMERGDHVED